jgi:hypothetical protein
MLNPEKESLGSHDIPSIFGFDFSDAGYSSRSWQLAHGLLSAARED